jgi:hypothetical protein
VAPGVKIFTALYIPDSRQKLSQKRKNRIDDRLIFQLVFQIKKENDSIFGFGIYVYHCINERRMDNKRAYKTK